MLIGRKESDWMEKIFDVAIYRCLVCNFSL